MYYSSIVNIAKRLHFHYNAQLPISNHSIGQKGEYILIVNTKMLIECCLVSMYGNFYIALISGECLK